MRSDSIDKERFVLGLVLSVNMWIFFVIVGVCPMGGRWGRL